MRRTGRVWIVGVLLWSGAVFASPIARAYEDRWTLGPLAGVAMNAQNQQGYEYAPIGGVTGSVGLDDVWSLRGQVVFGVHPGREVLQVGLLSTELVYNVDIVEWVPFFGAGVDAMGLWSSGASHVEAAFHGVVGVDYLLSPEYVLGIDVRAIVIPELGDSDSLDPVYVTATLRFEWLFDW